MVLSDGGLVINPPSDYGVQPWPFRGDWRMSIMRSPHGVVAERQAMHVPSWGRVGITANGRMMFSGPAEDAVSALDRIGPRGATLLGAGLGLVLSTNRIMGGLVGGGLGYLAGRYLANIIKTTVAVTRTASAVAQKVG